MFPRNRKSQSDPLARAKPLFLIGPPRSGTTMLTRFLNSHPRILLTNETAVFLQLHQNIEKSRIGVKAGLLYGKEYNDLWATYLESQSPRLLREYYSLVAKEQGKSDLAFWGEKHPHFHKSLNFLRTTYPDALFIYVIRDPRDAACSMAAMNGVPVKKSILNWELFSRHYERFVADIGADQVFKAIYERIVGDYEGYIREIVSWLGLDMTDQILQFISKHKNYDAHRLGSMLNKRENFANTSVGRWRQEFTDADRTFAAETVGNFLTKYGYEP